MARTPGFTLSQKASNQSLRLIILPWFLYRSNLRKTTVRENTYNGEGGRRREHDGRVVLLQRRDGRQVDLRVTESNLNGREWGSMKALNESSTSSR